MDAVKRMFENAEIVDPDAEDIEAIQRIEKENDVDEGISLADMSEIRAQREYSGRISLRLPRTLHHDLIEEAKTEGVSLNQLLLYKLTK